MIRAAAFSCAARWRDSIWIRTLTKADGPSSAMLDRFHGMNQHDDVQRQVVANPPGAPHFHRDEDRHGDPRPQPQGQKNPRDIITTSLSEFRTLSPLYPSAIVTWR